MILLFIVLEASRIYEEKFRVVIKRIGREVENVWKREIVVGGVSGG